MRNSAQMRTMLMTSEMLWPAAAAPSRGQGLQSALEQTFTKISCSFFDIKLSKKNGKALKMRPYKNATKSQTALWHQGTPPLHYLSGCSKTQMNHMHYTEMASEWDPSLRRPFKWFLASSTKSNCLSRDVHRLLFLLQDWFEVIWKYPDSFKKHP